MQSRTNEMSRFKIQLFIWISCRHAQRASPGGTVSYGTRSVCNGKRNQLLFLGGPVRTQLLGGSLTQDEDFSEEIFSKLV